MTDSQLNNIRGDGSMGQIENISIGAAVDGHEYEGKVTYKSGTENAPYYIIYSGYDSGGTLHIFDTMYMSYQFDTVGLEDNLSAYFIAP